jgi:hypothetical protein
VLRWRLANGTATKGLAVGSGGEESVLERGAGGRRGEELEMTGSPAGYRAKGVWMVMAKGWGWNGDADADADGDGWNETRRRRASQLNAGDKGGGTLLAAKLALPGGTSLHPRCIFG